MMWKTVLVVHLMGSMRPGETVWFEDGKRYKTRSRCEAGASAERMRMSKMLRRRFGQRVRIEAEVVAV